MTESEWAERYEITSLRGRIWTRPMLRKRVLDRARALFLPVEPKHVDAVLNDDAFMRFRRGEIPARVVEAIHDEARTRQQLESK